MSAPDRYVREVFVELTDTLVDEFDIIDFLDRLASRCVELLGVSACGLLLVDHHGTLNLIAASTERARLLELFELQSSEGPCLDAYHAGIAISCAELTEAGERWPRFAPTAYTAGFSRVDALPMRLRDEVIGALNLFSVVAEPVDPDVLELGQALANAATIGILHQRAVQRRDVVTVQLQGALNGRILIEQAKGFLAERRNISVEAAFLLLREYARASDGKLLDVARAVIDGTVTIEESGKPPSRSP
jgi:transcriptional regulator with GAF, ATPase, and Fis domain